MILFGFIGFRWSPTQSTKIEVEEKKVKAFDNRANDRVYEIPKDLFGVSLFIRQVDLSRMKILSNLSHAHSKVSMNNNLAGGEKWTLEESRTGVRFACGGGEKDKYLSQ